MLLCFLLSGSMVMAVPEQKALVEHLAAYTGEVYSVCKDARGAIWLATNDGLSVYDGFELTPVSRLRHMKPRLLEYDAGNDRLLAFDQSNLYCIEAGTERISYQKSFGRDAISDIAVTKDGFYVSTTSGVLSLFDKSGTVKKQISTRIQIAAITVIPGSGVFLTDRKKLYRYSESDGRLNLIETGRRDIEASDIGFTGDTLLLGTWHSGLQLYDSRSLQLITPPFLQALDSGNKSPSIATMEQGVLYSAFANSNFYIVDLKSKSQLNLTTENKVFYGKRFNCLFKDGNTIWIGTDNGLIRITMQQRLFRRMLAGAEPPVSTRAIVSVGEELYVGSYSGLIRFSRNHDQPENLNTGFKGNLKFITPYAMAAEGRYLYMVMESNNLYRYDMVEHTVSNSFYDVSGDVGMAAGYCITKDRSGNLWFGTQRGIVSFNPTTNRLTFADRGLKVNAAKVKSLFYDETSNCLLAAGSGGLYRIDLNNGRERHVESLAFPGIDSGELLFVSKEQDGMIWVGTNGDGVYQLDDQLNVVRHLQKEDGLSDNKVYAIVVTGNRAWMTTHHGLSSYDIDKHRFYNYYEEDGLSNNEFNHNSFLKKDGLLYMGGIDGVNIYDPKLLDQSQQPFRIYISGVRKWRADGGEQVTSITDATHFEKRPSDISMGIQLGVSVTSHAERTIFLYRISNIDSQWRQTSSHILPLDGLSYGNYEVEVKAIDYRGQLSENVLQISVNIVAPFYFRWWFYLLIAAVVAVIALVIFRLKLRSLNRYQLLRTQIASDLHDEVGSILTSISMYSDNLRSAQQSGRDPQEKIDKIANLSRRAIHSMKDILWAIDARNDATIDLAEHIRNHAEDLLLPKSINIHFKFDGDSTQKGLKGSARHHLYFITKEAVNNIARHSQATNVYIKFAVHRQHFELEIANDGLKQPVAMRKGLGLVNMKARATKMGAEFNWEISDERFVIRVRR